MVPAATHFGSVMRMGNLVFDRVLDRAGRSRSREDLVA